MKKNNKKPANISILVTVFCFSFIVFSAFAVDMAFVTLNRAKLQRAAETTALASVAKYKGSYLDDSRKYFNLYKTKTDTLKDAQLMNVQYKNEDNGDTKVKIEAQLVIPTYFLRFAGLKSVTIKANSYAKTYEQIQENIIFEAIRNMTVDQGTKENMILLYKELDSAECFGRSDISALLNISGTGAGVLLTKMKENNLIEPVKGFGKGKYKFKK